MASKKSAPIEELDESVAVEDIVVEDIVVDEEIEVLPEVVVDPTPDGNPFFIRAVNADSYLSIAERYHGEDISARDFARQLAELNGNAAVRPGARVRIR